MSGFLAVICGSGISGLDTQTLTCGQAGLAGSHTVGFISGSIGTITDGTSNIYSGAAITGLYWDQAGHSVALIITGVLANSGWTSMTRIGSGVVYSRASASFSTGGGFSTWEWAALDTFSMGADGATSTVVFQ